MKHVLEAVDRELLRGRLNALHEGEWLYHETKREHLPSIAAVGLKPTSYGQSFVRDDGSVMSPDEARDEIRSELEDDAMFEDGDTDLDRDFEAEADAALRERHPPEDFTPRTYVLLSEPRGSTYGEVLLRFPRSLASPTRKDDVDWYVREAIPPHRIEMREGGVWRRLA